MRYKDSSRRLTHPQEQDDQQYQFSWLEERNGMSVCLSWCEEKAQVCVHLPLQLCSRITALETNLQEQHCRVLFNFQCFFSFFSFPWWWEGTGEDTLWSSELFFAMMPTKRLPGLVASAQPTLILPTDAGL